MHKSFFAVYDLDPAVEVVHCEGVRAPEHRRHGEASCKPLVPLQGHVDAQLGICKALKHNNSIYSVLHITCRLNFCRLHSAPLALQEELRSVVLTQKV